MGWHCCRCHYYRPNLGLRGVRQCTSGRGCALAHRAHGGELDSLLEPVWRALARNHGGI
jgi:hypothetical protein